MTPYLTRRLSPDDSTLDAGSRITPPWRDRPMGDPLNRLSVPASAFYHAAPDRGTNYTRLPSGKSSRLASFAQKSSAHGADFLAMRAHPVKEADTDEFARPAWPRTLAFFTSRRHAIQGHRLAAKSGALVSWQVSRLRSKQGAYRPIPKYSKPSMRISAGSYKFRPSKMTGCCMRFLTTPKSGYRNGFHSVTSASAATPSRASY